MTAAVKALVDAAKAVSAEEQNNGPCSIGHPDPWTMWKNLEDALRAVEAESLHTETVEIPQGTYCKGCDFLEEGGENCGNKKNPTPRKTWCMGIREAWCRERYGFTENVKAGRESGCALTRLCWSCIDDCGDKDCPDYGVAG